MWCEVPLVGCKLHGLEQLAALSSAHVAGGLRRIKSRHKCGGVSRYIEMCCNCCISILPHHEIMAVHVIGYSFKFPRSFARVPPPPTML